MNVNFLKELTNNNFYHTLHNLLDFCNRRNKDLKRKLFLFMLPEKPFRPQLEPFLRLFELNLRSLQFTSVCKFENGSYLYTKLDCFHCVYPLDDQCANFFETECTHEKLSKTYRPYFLSVDAAKITFPPSDFRQNIFPIFLLHENLNQTMKLMKRLLQMKCNVSKNLSKCISFIKLGQSSPLVSMSMTGYSKCILLPLLPSRYLHYHILAGEHPHHDFLKECTEVAATKSYIGSLPFDPHCAIKYIETVFSIVKFKNRVSKLETRIKNVEQKQSQPQGNLTNTKQETNGSRGGKNQFISAVGNVQRDVD